MIYKYLFNFKLTIISLFVLTTALLYYKEFTLYFDFLAEETENEPGIFTENKLAQYDGVTEEKLYLSVLGIIFDVTEGKRHYEKGAGYHYFIGKDGSRAFVTGDFQDETKDKDHVMDLSCNELFTLLHWKSTFRQKYIEVGKLEGRFFNKKGHETDYAKQFNNKMRQCDIEKKNVNKEKLKYPPCNIAWSEEEGTKVWCTTQSGGVKRSWAGVPRQLYTPGIEEPRCICLNLDEKNTTTSLIKKYDKCPYKSTICLLKP